MPYAAEAEVVEGTHDLNRRAISAVIGTRVVTEHVDLVGPAGRERHTGEPRQSLALRYLRFDDRDIEAPWASAMLINMQAQFDAEIAREHIATQLDYIEHIT